MVCYAAKSYRPTSVTWSALQAPIHFLANTCTQYTHAPKLNTFTYFVLRVERAAFTFSLLPGAWVRLQQCIVSVGDRVMLKVIVWSPFSTEVASIVLASAFESLVHRLTSLFVDAGSCDNREYFGATLQILEDRNAPARDTVSILL